MRSRSSVGILALSVLACQVPGGLTGDLRAGRPSAGAVVSEHRLATKVGVEILEAGGNAADAAVATALALAVVYPAAGNLGGGGFAVWAPAEGQASTLDFRELAPAGYEPRLYLDEQGEVVTSRSLETPLAVGVPGSPAGLFALYREHGSKRLSFEELCRPAIQLAEQGFLVDPWLSRGLRGARPGAGLRLTLLRVRASTRGVSPWQRARASSRRTWVQPCAATLAVARLPSTGERRPLCSWRPCGSPTSGMVA